MNRGLLAILLLAFLVTPALAFTELNSTTPTQDTYYPNGETANCGPFGNQSNPHGNETDVILNCNAGASNSWYGLFQYNWSRSLSLVIDTVNWTVDKTIAQCTSGTFTVSTSSNTSWTESQVVLPMTSTKTVSTLTIGSISTGLYTSTANASNPTTMDALYDRADVTTVQTQPTALSCTTTGDKEYIQSKEGGSLPATWNFVLKDIANAQITNVFTFLNQDLYFDFESFFGSSSTFAQADFRYNNATNTLTPSVPAVAVVSEQTTANTLSAQNCFGATGYSTAPIDTINFPSGNYWVICFNLSSEHNGRTFYGAIKVTNTTPSLQYYAALYSPSYTSFSTPTINPSPAQQYRNVTITWTTTQPTTTGLRYQYTLGGSTSPLATVYNGSLFTTSHTAVINASNIFSGAFYSFSLYGETASGSGFGSNQSYNFTAENFQQTVADINDGITIITTSEYNTPLRTFVGIDGFAPLQTFQLDSNNSQYGYFELMSFFNFNNGLHNITVSKIGYATQNITIDVTSQPFFKTVKLLPEFACTAVGNFQTNTSCVDNGNSGRIQADYPALNTTAFYCQYDASLCFLFSNTTCIQSPLGGWKQYACFDGYFPAGFPVNGTVGSGAAPDNPSISQPIGDAIGSIFGVSGVQGLAGISTLLIAILAFAAGIYIRSGILTVTSVVLFIFSFTFFGWIPIWILVMFAVITAFLVAKFFRQTATPE